MRSFGQVRFAGYPSLHVLNVPLPVASLSQGVNVGVGEYWRIRTTFLLVATSTCTCAILRGRLGSVRLGSNGSGPASRARLRQADLTALPSVATL